MYYSINNDVQLKHLLKCLPWKIWQEKPNRVLLDFLVHWLLVAAGGSLRQYLKSHFADGTLASFAFSRICKANGQTINGSDWKAAFNLFLSQAQHLPCSATFFSLCPGILENTVASPGYIRSDQSVYSGTPNGSQMGKTSGWFDRKIVTVVAVV